MMKITLTALLGALLAAAPAVAQSQLEARLQDGRRVMLKSDGTFEILKSDRSISVRLKSMGAPEGFMSDARRDCGLVFEVENNLGGQLIAFNADLEIQDKAGAKVLRGGVMNYDLDLFSFEPANLLDGQAKNITIDVEMSCDQIAVVQMPSIEEKYCNFVGRQPEDKCRSLLSIESSIPTVNFKM